MIQIIATMLEITLCKNAICLRGTKDLDADKLHYLILWNVPKMLGISTIIVLKLQ